MNKQNKQSKKLVLATQTVRELGEKQLDLAGGGLKTTGSRVTVCTTFRLTC